MFFVMKKDVMNQFFHEDVATAKAIPNKLRTAGFPSCFTYPGENRGQVFRYHLLQLFGI